MRTLSWLVLLPLSAVIGGWIGTYDTGPYNNEWKHEQVVAWYASIGAALVAWGLIGIERWLDRNKRG